MELAVGLWNPDTSGRAMASLRADGVAVVEPGPSFLLQEDDAEYDRAVERFHAAGVRFYACHAPFGGDDDLSQLDEEKRQGALANHMAALARAARAGANCIVVHPGGSTEAGKEETRLDRLRDSLAALLVPAENAGVRLALENMLPGLVAEASATVRRVVDEFDSPYLGVCFDTGHAHVTEEGVARAFTTLGERIIAFHLDDNDGHADRHLQPPYGTIDWSAFARQLQAMDFAQPMTVEARPWNRAPLCALLWEVQELLTNGRLTVPFGDREVWAICPRCGHYLFGTHTNPTCSCQLG